MTLWSIFKVRVHLVAAAATFIHISILLLDDDKNLQWRHRRRLLQVEVFQSPSERDLMAAGG